MNGERAQAQNMLSGYNGISSLDTNLEYFSPLCTNIAAMTLI